MSSKVAKVVKGSSVEVSGKALVMSGRTSSSCSAVVSSPADTSANVKNPQVPQEARIVESNSEYAIIEVVCSCGAKSHIQCNYAAMTKE